MWRFECATTIPIDLYRLDEQKSGIPAPHEENTNVLPTSSSYDPWRTVRHLTVGIVASIPSYEWYIKTASDP
jgi:hypothetical protein